MTSLLSSVTAQLGKGLALATLLPVALFVTGGFILVEFVLGGSAWEWLGQTDKGWQQVFAIPFVGLLATGLLYNLNVPLTRVYEGYPWQTSLLGRLRTNVHQKRRDALDARRRGLRTLVYFSSRGATLDPRVRPYWTDVAREVASAFPKRESVLPTLLGNVVRCFENYPQEQYGMSAIPLWPRLLAKIDERYATAIDDAKVSFDFALNCSALSCGLGVVLVGVGALHPAAGGTVEKKLAIIALVLASVALSYFFYVMAIGRAAAWGELVKGAFDLYRRSLLTQLAFDAAPRTVAQERSVWRAISQTIIFGESPRQPLPGFAARATTAEGEPPYATLKVTRGITTVAGDTVLTVTICVENATAPACRVERAVVTDVLPASLSFVWGSSTVPVAGVNPYRFEVGHLDAGQAREFSYRVVPWKEP
jgi:uncharacterized repeat protein (TIGR01451 family)